MFVSLFEQFRDCSQDSSSHFVLDPASEGPTLLCCVIFHIDPVGNTHLSRPKKCYEILIPFFYPFQMANSNFPSSNKFKPHPPSLRSDICAAPEGVDACERASSLRMQLTRNATRPGAIATAALHKLVEQPRHCDFMKIPVWLIAIGGFSPIHCSEQSSRVGGSSRFFCSCMSSRLVWSLLLALFLGTTSSRALQFDVKSLSVLCMHVSPRFLLFRTPHCSTLQERRIPSEHSGSSGLLAPY